MPSVTLLWRAECRLKNQLAYLHARNKLNVNRSMVAHFKL